MFNLFTAQYDCDYDHSLLFLPGRGGDVRHFIAEYLDDSNLEKCNVYGIQPRPEWYPAPNGSNDQLAAVNGLKTTIENLRLFLTEMQEKGLVVIEKTILVGFSAGSVVAFELLNSTKLNFLSFICHNGAILEPENLNPCHVSSSILVFHSKDDDCFEWDERYIPMRNALKDKGYLLTTVEKNIGGHRITKHDMSMSHAFIKQKFSTNPKT